MFQKLIAFGVVLALAVVVTGCGNDETAQSTNDNLSSENLFDDSNDAAKPADPKDADAVDPADNVKPATDDTSSDKPAEKEEPKPENSPPTESVKPTIGFVTNGIASFWVIAEAGARAAAAELGVNVEIRMPPSPEVENQKRMLEELVTLEVDGVAVSPIDPDNQNDLLNMVAENTNLITHDSDAPKSNRLGYVGMSNYSAGRMCGELVKEALPDGGSLIIFVGRLEQLNARQRRQGVIDELLGRDFDADRFDKPGSVIEGKGYKILSTRTDNFDFAKAKSLAEDAIVAHPDLGAMVGLFAYNPPNILEALKTADKLGQIKVIGFDEADETLQAIKDGHCVGTVVQDPWMYGYKSVELLTKMARGDESVFKASDFVDIPARKVIAGKTDEAKKTANVDEFWTVLKQRLGKGDKE